MNSTVIDLAKDKKISDFADVVKAELKKKVLDNDFVKDKKEELDKYNKVSDTLSKLTKVDDTEVKDDIDDEQEVTNVDDVKPEE